MSNYVVSFLLVVWLFCLSFLSSPNRGTPSVLNPRLNPVSIGAVFENKAPVSKVIDTPSAKITKENILNLKKYSSLEIENNYGVDWSPDGKLIAQATSKGVYLFPATTLRQNTFIDFPYAYAVQFAHSSKLLAIGSYNQNSNEGALSVWDISTQQMIWQEKFQGGGITEISFSEDDSYIAFSGMITASGKTKYLATITSANEPKEIFTTYVNEQPIPISWEGEKLWFFSGGNQYSIRYYDIRSKNVYGFVQSKEFNASNDMSFYHPGQILAFDRVGDLHMWDMKKKKQVIVYYEDNSHGGYVQFSTLGKYIFHKGIVREVGSGAVVATLGESLQFIDWSPDETKMVISRGKEHETAVINFKNGYVYQQKIWSGPMGFADVSPTGNYLAMQIYGTREIEVFDLQDFSKPIKVIHCKFDNVGIFVKFSTDGSLMATCSEDKYGLTIWDTTVWENGWRCH